MLDVFAWLRRRLIAGFFITVPLAVSVIALLWFFRIVNAVTSGVYERVVGRQMQGPEIVTSGIGIVITALMVFVIGVVATNVLGRRLLLRAESLLMHVPLFKTVYAPVKQLLAAFAPDNEYGFKRVVLVETGGRGFVLGFLTKELVLDRGLGPEELIAVYVPTNNLYLGDVMLFPRARATFPDVTVEQGIRVFLTGGMALPLNIRSSLGGHRSIDPGQDAGPGR
jgi:uncharacterized membrane protein